MVGTYGHNARGCVLKPWSLFGMNLDTSLDCVGSEQLSNRVYMTYLP